MRVKSIFFLYIVILVPLIRASDIPSEQEVEIVVKQIAFENFQLLPHIGNKEAYALLFTSKVYNNAVTEYRKNQVCEFDKIYGSHNKEIYIFKDDIHGKSVISSDGIIFDASGNYASGYIKRYDFSHIKDQGKKARKFFVGHHHYGRCVFRYPSLEHVQTKVSTKQRMEAYMSCTTFDRKIALSVVKNYQGTYDVIASVWSHTLSVMHHVHGNVQCNVDETDVYYRGDHGIRSFKSDGTATGSGGEKYNWWKHRHKKQS